MAELVIIGWFASAAISILIKELIEFEKKQGLLGLSGELGRLKRAMPMIEAIWTNTDPVLIREEKNRGLEDWMWQLRDAVEQAYNTLDTKLYNLEKEKAPAGKKKFVSKTLSNIETVLKRVVDKDPILTELKQAVTAIDEAAANVGQFLKLAKGLKKEQINMNKSAKANRETSSVLDAGTRRSVWAEKKAHIITKLLSPQTNGKNYSVLPIIGPGLVGKTTLAKLVYNDPRVHAHFGLKMWVCININFDVLSLTKKLYESVFKRNAGFDSLDVIQSELVDELKSKRFLVVFDDACDDSDRVEWKKLFAAFEDGASGSMVLLTTQMNLVIDTIGKFIRPNLLDPEFLEGYNDGDMLNILVECAFGGKNPDCREMLVEIGKDIVKKLKGSALAAKTVGGLLQPDLSVVHWTAILGQDLWSLKAVQNDIMKYLILTYQNLPLELKPCFSFYSIFPHNHVFIKDDLIRMWIALGLVPNSATGSDNFDFMLKRSIFHSRGEQPSEGYVMAQLMHDLSTFVTQGECFRTNTGQPESVSIPKTVRHLYVHVSDPHELTNSGISDLKNLHTLILHFDESNSPNLNALVNEVLRETKNLRVLTLFAPSLSVFPENASNLLHLRYLGLHSNNLRVQSESLSRLYLLETKAFSPGVSEEVGPIVPPIPDVSEEAMVPIVPPIPGVSEEAMVPIVPPIPGVSEEAMDPIVPTHWWSGLFSCLSKPSTKDGSFQRLKQAEH